LGKGPPGMANHAGFDRNEVSDATIRMSAKYLKRRATKPRIFAQFDLRPNQGRSEKRQRFISVTNRTRSIDSIVSLDAFGR
jgi:hypothetical protein